MAINIPGVYVSQIADRPINQSKLTIRANAQQFGAGIGQAIGDLGDSVGEVADVLVAKENITAKADGDAAYYDYMNVRRDILRDPESGYLNQTGENALGGRDSLDDNLAAARAKVEDGLSPKARRLFNDKANAADAQGQDQAISHESQQLRAYTNDATQAAIETSLKEAELLYDDDAASQAYLDDAIASVEEQAALQGWKRNVTDGVIRDMTSKTMIARATNLAYDDPITADAFLDEQHKKGTLNQSEYATAKKALKPIVVQAKARAIVAPMAQSLFLGDTDQYGHPSWMVGGNGYASGAESNSQFDTNPNSTATGLPQFIEETYLRQVDKVRAKGGAIWSHGLTREQILATRTDPTKEGEIYRDFRKDNAAALVKNGHAVTPRNEYIMHHFGTGNPGGGGMLRSAANGDYNLPIGAIISPAAMEANPHLAGMTLGAVLHMLEGKTGKGGGGVGNPAQAYAAVLAIKDQDVRKEAMTLLAQTIAMQDKIEAEQSEALQQKGWEHIVNGGNPDDLPVDMKIELGAAALQNLNIAANNYALGSDVNDDARYNELYDMGHGTDPVLREQFLKLDLNHEMTSLDRGHLAKLKADQFALREAKKTSDKEAADDAKNIYTYTDYNAIYADSKRAFNSTGKTEKDNPQDWNRFTEALRGRLDAYALKHGEQMPKAMVLEVSGFLVMDTLEAGAVMGKAWQTKKHAYDIPYRGQGIDIEIDLKSEQIKHRERSRIFDKLSNDWGRVPTSDEIVEYRELEILQSIGLRPELEYSEVPLEIREVILNANPGFTDQQLIDHYLDVIVTGK